MSFFRKIELNNIQKISLLIIIRIALNCCVYKRTVRLTMFFEPNFVYSRSVIFLVLSLSDSRVSAVKCIFLWFAKPTKMYRDVFVILTTEPYLQRSKKCSSNYFWFSILWTDVFKTHTPQKTSKKHLGLISE